MARTEKPADGVTVIKKYANRRLYNTATSSYVTLEHLCQMVKDGEEFVVYDAKTGEDITRPVLAQIIFEEEGKGQHMLPTSFLRQLIGFYGDNLQSMVPSYLEATMEAFARNQEQMRTYMTEALGDANPFRQMEEAGRRNMAMFQQAMSMFTPFAGATGPEQPEGAGETAAAPKPEADQQDELELLRRQMLQMQSQLNKLVNKQSDDGQ